MSHKLQNVWLEKTRMAGQLVCKKKQVQQSTTLPEGYMDWQIEL